jgi:peptidoglycan/LPS O-acetylase OafA/YrhL
MEKTRAERLIGLDAIRFVAALVVFLGHVGGPPLVGEDAHGPARLVLVVLHAAFNGPAAVIVFFVLSGLVIHHPLFASGASPGLAFLARRYVRILGPVLASLALAKLVGHNAIWYLQGVLWSLWAELIYYTIYPVLLPLGRRHGWAKLIALSYVPAFAVSILHGNTNFTIGDTRTDWIVGLPCWLTGCWVAEHLGDRAVSFARMWAWRLAIYGAGSVLLVLCFHTALTYRYTLPLFSIPVALWLVREIAYYRARPGAAPARAPWRWLERAGGWSYSLYIAHPVAGMWVGTHPAVLGLAGQRPLPHWTWEVTVILALCYAFARVFERPSQRLARGVAAAIGARARGARAAS